MLNISHLLSHLPIIGGHFRPPAPPAASAPPVAGDRLARSGPRQEATRTFAGFSALPPASGAHKLGAGPTLLVHNPNARAPQGPGLTMMSFNILKGGERRAELEAYLGGLGARMPDVIALQEANQEVSARLAEQYGYHLAYFGREKDARGRLLNGKAILSRHPIETATHFTYALSDAERQAAIQRKGKAGELNEDRGALRATLRIGGRSVDVFDVHHTLGDAKLNADQLTQLTGLVRQSAGQGREALVVGDFNANLLVRSEGSWWDAHRGPYDRTDTGEEFQARYGSWWGSLGDAGLGNIGVESVRTALAGLEAVVPSSFETARETVVRQPDQSLLSPEEAIRRLNSGAVDQGSAEWYRLQDAADGATLTYANGMASGKRFDGVFATPGLAPRRLEIDRTSRASDHQPVITQFDLQTVGTSIF